MGRGLRRGEEGVFVDVRVVSADVDAEASRVVAVGELSVLGSVMVKHGKKVPYWMHLAVADGPNHSPGCLPHALAP